MTRAMPARARAPTSSRTSPTTRARRASLTVDATAVSPLVATSSNDTTIAASDDTVYVVHLPAGGAAVLATTPDHVVDVAFDSPWAIWTTRGQGSTPAQLWRMVVP